MKKMHAYVDGYNLYYGMMDKSYLIPGDNSKPVLRKYLWLNLQSFISSYFPSFYSLEKIHYFTAPVRNNPGAVNRQAIYWKALWSITNLQIHIGKHLRKKNAYEEKQTDVRMALQMYDDALHAEGLQAMTLLCADSDQIPTIEKIQALNKGIEIRVIFPPCRHSDDLLKLFPGRHKTTYKRLKDNQFPDHVKYEREGVVVVADKPQEWT